MGDVFVLWDTCGSRGTMEFMMRQDGGDVGYSGGGAADGEAQALPPRGGYARPSAESHGGTRLVPKVWEVNDIANGCVLEQSGM